MKPTLFNTDMVRAILEDLKTVTRRVVKDPYYIDDEEASRVSGLAIHRGTNMTDGMPYPDQPYLPGDILYVPEPWKCRKRPNTSTLGYEVVFKDGSIIKFQFTDRKRFDKWRKYWDKPDNQWQSPYFMPREAARIFLRVKDLKVQRVQDITDEEARKEGCKDRDDFHRVWNDCYAKPQPVKVKGIIDHYESYPWEDIRETRTYHGRPWYVIGNPWVWVIKFERISREEAEHG